MMHAVTAFRPFSTEHGIAFLAGAGCIAALIFAGRKGGNARKLATAVLAFCNLAAYPMNLAAWMAPGLTPAMDNLLPFHLCDIAAITAGFALLLRKHTLAAVTYFWGLAATFQALLTPAISVGFPAWAFITFFIQHFAIVGAALFLPIVDGWRPERPWWKTPLKIYVLTVIYLLCAMGINALLGTNFAFASRPPDNPSLIDHLGPWPVYLISLNVICLAVFLLLALPFLRHRKTDGTNP